ncbi:MAG TPA: thiosulfate oxidation carrier protein SoxY [Hyphomicrobiaceae bacterium]|nr:thiosulfate oxidation carrier protein SoxY [Hyphomicrobiaceae bacterium]
MNRTRGTSAPSRRDALLGAAAGASLIALAGPGALLAQDKSPPAVVEEAIKKIMGDAKPFEGRIALDLPETAENGNTVPYTVSVDSPMTASDYVKAVHILATGNVQPGVATFFFTPESGKAAVSSRMRLSRTQDVLAIAELSTGRFVMARRPVKVTIGCCGG